MIERGLEVCPASLAAIDSWSADVAMFGVWDDVRFAEGLLAALDWRLAGALSLAKRQGLMPTKCGEALMLGPGARLDVNGVLILGQGRKADWDEVTESAFVKQVAKTAGGLGVHRLILNFDDPHEQVHRWLSQLASELGKAGVDGARLLVGEALFQNTQHALERARKRSRLSGDLVE